MPSFTTTAAGPAGPTGELSLTAGRAVLREFRGRMAQPRPSPRAGAGRATRAPRRGRGGGGGPSMRPGCPADRDATRGGGPATGRAGAPRPDTHPQAPAARRHPYETHTPAAAE